MNLPSLSPAQRDTANKILAALEANTTVRFSHDQDGLGMTLVLDTLAREVGGVVLTAADFSRKIDETGDADRFETSLFELFEEAFRDNDIVYVDGAGITGTPFYVRIGLHQVNLPGIIALAERLNRKIVTTGWSPSGVQVQFSAFTEADYRHIISEAAPGVDLGDVDFALVMFVAGHLTARQLAQIGHLVGELGSARPTTDDVLAQLPLATTSNLRIDDVEKLSFSDLSGVDDLIERLDRSVLLPYRNPRLAMETGLQPKHGVLLYGPPGMGKTSIGRALANEMEGKFFIIDGDWTQGRGCFYKSCRALFHAARMASPSVLFIDDADVILSDPGMRQWGRFLLTMLDGLRSDASEVCVMMTAMDIADLPPALLRSGRLEVWLELKPPAREGRREILERHIGKLPFPVDAGELEPVLDMTENYSPADLRRLVGDALSFKAADRLDNRTERAFADYLALSAPAVAQQREIVRNQAMAGA